MTRTLVLAVVMLLTLFMLGGCPLTRVEGPSVNNVKKPEAEIPTDREELKKELISLHARERIIEGALEDAKIDALQTKIWVGVGLCVLAGLVLIAIGIWTTRRILVEVGIGALGLASLGAVAAWLVPYILWTGVGVSVIVIGTVIFMLANREKALRQVTEAVNDSKSLIPEFKKNYQQIFNGRIDTGVDLLLNSIRGIKK